MTSQKKPLIEFWNIEEDRYGQVLENHRISLKDMIPYVTPMELRMIYYRILMNRDKIKEELK